MTLVSPWMTWIDLDAQAQVLAHGVEWLTPQEHKKAEKLVSDQMQHRAKAARVFLRATLARYLQQHPGRIEISIGEFGKPRVENGPQFNLSHAGKIAVLALHPNLPIGVDVERPPRAIGQMNLWSSLTSAERENPPSTVTEWLRLWVRKEAVSKASGQGLNADLTSFNVGHDGGDLSDWRKIRSDRDPAVQLTAGCLPTGDPVALALVADSAPKDGVRLETADAVALISGARLLAGHGL